MTSWLRRLYRGYRAALVWVGLGALILGLTGAVGTLLGVLPPVLDKALWPRVSNTILWFLVAREGFDMLGEWLGEEVE